MDILYDPMIPRNACRSPDINDVELSVLPIRGEATVFGRAIYPISDVDAAAAASTLIPLRKKSVRLSILSTTSTCTVQVGLGLQPE